MGQRRWHGRYSCTVRTSWRFHHIKTINRSDRRIMVFWNTKNSFFPKGYRTLDVRLISSDRSMSLFCSIAALSEDSDSSSDFTISTISSSVSAMDFSPNKNQSNRADGQSKYKEVGKASKKRRRHKSCFDQRSYYS